jgi:uncharacterized membrane protein
MVSFLPYHYQIFSWVALLLNPTYHFLSLLYAKTQKTLCALASLRLCAKQNSTIFNLIRQHQVMVFWVLLVA